MWGGLQHDEWGDQLFFFSETLKMERDCCNPLYQTTQQSCNTLWRSNSVPYAYFRVSSRHSPIHASQWAKLARSRLVSFHFFRFVREDDASISSRDYCSSTVFRVLVKLDSVTYATICGSPHMATMCIMAKDSRMINSHTLLHLMVEYASLKAEGVSWLRYPKSSRRTPCSCEHVAMRWGRGVTLVARERRCEYILRAKKKQLTINTYATSNHFSVFLIYPPIYMCVSQATFWEFLNVWKRLPD